MARQREREREADDELALERKKKKHRQRVREKDGWSATGQSVGGRQKETPRRVVPGRGRKRERGKNVTRRRKGTEGIADAARTSNDDDDDGDDLATAFMAFVRDRRLETRYQRDARLASTLRENVWRTCVRARVCVCVCVCVCISKTRPRRPRRGTS